MVKTKYLIFWIVFALVFASIDWYEHISREGQSFEKYPLRWGIYSLVRCLVLILFTIAYNLLLKEFIKHRYSKEIIAFLMGMFTVQQFGPLMNRFIIPELNLIYNANYLNYIWSIACYSFIYFILYFLRNKKNEKNTFTHQ
jgi:hypothetical protein